MSSALGAEQLLLLPLLLLSTKYLIVKVCHAEQRKVATTNDDGAAATNFLALPKKKIVKMSPAPWNPEPVSLATDQQQEFHQHSKFKSIPMRPSPIVHPAVDAPICPECQALEMTFSRRKEEEAFMAMMEEKLTTLDTDLTSSLIG